MPRASSSGFSFRSAAMLYCKLGILRSAKLDMGVYRAPATGIVKGAPFDLVNVN